MYCVYLTVYSGNLLPMFYIGSSSITKVKGGYCGSISSKKYKKIFLKEKKENSHLFRTHIISQHDTRSQAISKEYKLQKQLNVSTSTMYFNECYASGYFGQRNSGKNNGFYGRKHSEQTLQKMKKPKSEETKQKMRKPKSEEHRNNLKGSINWQHRDYSIKEECIHCGVLAMKTNITRWHNNNCKLIKKSPLMNLLFQ